MAQNTIILELNTIMMRNTFKIEGEGSTGSCFLIGKPFKNDKTKGRIVLVTAAHVLEEIKSDYATIYLRKKEKESFIKYPFKIGIKNNGQPLWLKNLSGHDVAVMYLRLPNDIDHQLLPSSMLANDDILRKYEIHPGDDLLCLGYPFGFEANETGFPILRSGKIASFPLVPTDKNATFLLDFKVFKGNSGGPVYFAESNRNYAGGTHVGKIQFIVGLVSKEFLVTERTKTFYETKEQIYPLSLAVIIHSSHILNTINQLPEEE